MYVAHKEQFREYVQKKYRYNADDDLSWASIKVVVEKEVGGRSYSKPVGVISWPSTSSVRKIILPSQLPHSLLQSSRASP